MRKIFAVLFVGALILLPCVLRGQDSTTQDDQERQQKIQELQNDIEEQEQEAARWDQTAQDVSGGSDSISNMIGELGAAKARQNAAEARQKAQQDREEIERLMNMPVEHVDIDTSYSGALQQQENQNPTPSIVDTGNQQAEQLRDIGDANAAAQRRAAEERIQAQQQAEQERLAQQQAAEQAAQQQQAQQQAQQQSVTVSEGELIKSPNSPNVYVVQGGQLHLIPDPATLQSQWSWSQVQTVPQSTIDGMPVGSAIPAVASQNCTNMDKWVNGTVKLASDGFVVGHLTNNSNQILYVSFTFAQGGKPSGPETGAVTIQPGQTIGGEGGGIWAPGNSVDSNPPYIYWHAVLQSDVDAGKVCPSEW